MVSSGRIRFCKTPGEFTRKPGNPTTKSSTTKPGTDRDCCGNRGRYRTQRKQSLKWMTILTSNSELAAVTNRQNSCPHMNWGRQRSDIVTLRGNHLERAHGTAAGRSWMNALGHAEFMRNRSARISHPALRSWSRTGELLQKTTGRQLLAAARQTDRRRSSGNGWDAAPAKLSEPRNSQATILDEERKAKHGEQLLGSCCGDRNVSHSSSHLSNQPFSADLNSILSAWLNQNLSIAPFNLRCCRCFLEKWGSWWFSQRQWTDWIIFTKGFAWQWEIETKEKTGEKKKSSVFFASP